MDRRNVHKAKPAKKKIPIVFISHYAHEDSELAKKFKQWIETHFKVQRVKVFASSAESCIKTGTFFMSKIGQMLTMKDVLISLLTPASMSRPWVIFETGTGVCSKALLPILCRGAQKENLPPPFQELQIKDASIPSQFHEVLCELDKALGGRHTDVGVEELRNCLSANTKKETVLSAPQMPHRISPSASEHNLHTDHILPSPPRAVPQMPRRSGPPVRAPYPPRPIRPR